MYEIEFKQRAYDGKWEMLANILDPNEKYEDWIGKDKSLVPFRWVTVKVFDWLLEVENV